MRNKTGKHSKSAGKSLMRIFDLHTDYCRFAIGDFYKTHCEQGGDIVILELEKAVEDVEGANYACLPFAPKTEIKEGVNVTSFGWGSDPGKGFDNSAFPMIQILNLGEYSIRRVSQKSE